VSRLSAQLRDDSSAASDGASEPGCRVADGSLSIPQHSRRRLGMQPQLSQYHDRSYLHQVTASGVLLRLLRFSDFQVFSDLHVFTEFLVFYRLFGLQSLQIIGQFTYTVSLLAEIFNIDVLM